MKTRKKDEPVTSFLFVLGILALLVTQTTATVLFMQYSRRVSQEVVDDGKPPVRYATSTAVVLAEFFKMCFGMFVVGFIEPREKSQGPFGAIAEKCCSSIKDLSKMMVPSACYTIQNNLLFVALSNLDSAVYQVVYQLKVLTTAIFSVTMLNKSISWEQWGALLLLFCGAALAQTAGNSQKEGQYDPLVGRSTLIGLTSCILATVSSGFAGVWFEKVLKGSRPSLYVRNIQLGFFGTIVGICTVIVKDWETVITNGFFGGYNWRVWVVILLNTAGGYIVANVVKYTSNLVKAFANGLSIILCGILSIIFFDFPNSLQFWVAVCFVLWAIKLYSVK